GHVAPAEPQSPARLPLYRHGAPRGLPPFPTRRSSDLQRPAGHDRSGGCRRRRRGRVGAVVVGARQPLANLLGRLGQPFTDTRKEDRKSTRLNSSHVKISYAVFCLKKKRHNASTTSSPA